MGARSRRSHRKAAQKCQQRNVQRCFRNDPTNPAHFEASSTENKANKSQQATSNLRYRLATICDDAAPRVHNHAETSHRLRRGHRCVGRNSLLRIKKRRAGEQGVEGRKEGLTHFASSLTWKTGDRVPITTAAISAKRIAFENVFLRFTSRQHNASTVSAAPPLVASLAEAAAAAPEVEGRCTPGATVVSGSTTSQRCSVTTRRPPRRRMLASLYFVTCCECKSG
jgi:hypothetical protein